jgi:hypothetical protein
MHTLIFSGIFKLSAAYQLLRFIRSTVTYKFSSYNIEITTKTFVSDQVSY